MQSLFIGTIIVYTIYEVRQMLILVWLIPIAGGPIIQVFISNVLGYSLGAVPLVILYAVLFSIAGTLTARIVSHRKAKANDALKAHEKEHGALNSSSSNGDKTGVLECTEEAFVFTDTSGQTEEYLYMDVHDVWVKGKKVFIVDSKYEEHSFQVDNPQIWLTKIEQIRKKPFEWDGKYKVIQLLRSFEGTEEELDQELLLMRRKNLITKEYARLAVYEYKAAKKENRKINEKALGNEDSLTMYWYHQGRCIKCGGEVKKTAFNKKCLNCGYIDTSG